MSGTLVASEEINLAEGALSSDAHGHPTLVGGACESCGTEFFPKYEVCPHCMSEAIAAKDMPKRGKLYSFTTLHVGAQKWRKPLTVGYVDLPNDVRVFAHLEGEAFKFDQPVELGVGRVGADADGTPITTFVFRSVET